jgi:hypothetical protein
MPGALHHHRADIEARLFQRDEEHLGLCRAVDDIVLGAPAQQKRRRLVVAGYVTDRRGVEIKAPVLRRRGAQKLLADPIVGPWHQIVMPLLQHIVDTVDADDGLHPRVERGMRVVMAGAGEARIIASERSQRRQMRAGGVADKSDALRVGLHRRAGTLDELHRRADVVHRCRKTRLARLGETIVDGKQRIAARRQPGAPMPIAVAGSELPAAAMHRHQHRVGAGLVGHVQVAEQHRPVVSRIFDATANVDAHQPLLIRRPF